MKRVPVFVIAELLRDVPTGRVVSNGSVARDDHVLLRIFDADDGSKPLTR
jgi:hypothetical protein